MRYEHDPRHRTGPGPGPGPGGGRRPGGGGVPDGLLLSVIGLGVTVLFVIWSATGLAGLFAHGSWPAEVSFTRTPPALRSLIIAPDDLVAAWPATPPGELSGYGLFWGLAIGQLMLLAVLTVFVIGTLARWKAVREARRATERRRAHRDPYADEDDGGREGAYEAVPYGDGPKQPHTSPYKAPAAPPPPYHPEPPRPAAEPPAAEAPAPQVPTAPAAPPTAPGPAPATDPVAAAVRAPAVPAPRDTTAPRVFFGDPATRRPAALRAVREAEGPLLVVTSDPAVWAETKDARAKLGPVLVYDPGHLCDTPARLHWNPAAHCEDASTAQARAAALLAPVRPHARIDAAMADTAETLLRCWLHAAAVDGRPFKQVHRWAQGINAQDSVRILRTHTKATAGLAGLLEAALTAHPERREIAQQLVARALGSLSSIHIREACTPNRTDALTLESFIAEGGTLYLVGEAIEDPKAHPGAMPLLTALASDVVEHGRRMAARSSAGRLDPPLALVLDDAAAVAPLPQVPDLLTTGPSVGLPAFVLLRSPEQARARWQNPLPHH
ncbi:type IV secretory system conjugative DNA transfer family protein [Streptomyces sp. NPDC059248]|uniref:type IV secretory system conjugative DNA transfer family protein n=1 Tax=Streptomyces sp. NPDC059248 TaxID=3346791 RepID=UPI0036976409